MTLISCDNGSPTDKNQLTVDKDISKVSAAATTASVAASAPPENNHVEAQPVRTAIIGGSEIPYPIYPNGSRYRVGGENGLKIVLYQTKDPFEKVDQYYRSKAQEVGMPRLSAMADYVRYAIGEDDQDPWGTERPGIVIHQFNDDRERAAVGADQEALTNIIMSF